MKTLSEALEQVLIVQTEKDGDPIDSAGAMKSFQLQMEFADDIRENVHIRQVTLAVIEALMPGIQEQVSPLVMEQLGAIFLNGFSLGITVGVQMERPDSGEMKRILAGDQDVH